ncbi:EAL domain-containing protein [Marinobacter sp. CHS3-4]|uniref:putative bifunctional diguanylate cyclase/phosphodiesterase n=1 Tax=Marinobacter sp. CHS3-4 TaxID=3045174 RepID=UPI0024B553E8|nr:EAL domain-containing protein [Marinobacter sp. CHS3-4]MDI9245616.1 EAL domain-containing protein [Marinobacter sp. CHS3-4]
MTRMPNEVRILLIEDDEDDSFLVERQLKRMTRFQAKIETVRDLDRGLEIALDQNFDAVFIDYYWGGKTADTVIVEERSFLRSVPLVVITSTDDFEINERVVEAGAWDFIAKDDLNPKLLERTILHAIERKRHENELHKLVRHDSLTGLGNRLMFEEQLDKATSRADRQSSRCAVMALDLDDFKQVNDSLGHDVGDMLLRLVADRLERGLRLEDTLARLGGDEFAILIQDVENSRDLETIADKLLASLREPTPIKGISGKVTGSFGIALYPDNAKSPLELMRYADIALYASKDRGCDRVSLFNDQLEKELLGSLELEQELRSALNSGSLIPYFQPRYGIDDNHLYGVEVLMRWQHPSRGTLLPGEFMPVAERAGLIFEMDRSLIKNTLELLSSYDALPSEILPYQIAFNITAAQLLDVDFPKQMQKLVGSFNLNPGHVEFEIVESVLVERQAQETLAELRNAGFGLAIDDFGTGFSSFSYLKDLPVTAIKLDRSFIKDLNVSTANHAICEAIAHVGKRLGLLVIGEGIETDSELEALSELEVDSVQGFLFAKPMNAADWIAKQHQFRQEARNV